MNRLKYILMSLELLKCLLIIAGMMTLLSIQRRQGCVRNSAFFAKPSNDYNRLLNVPDFEFTMLNHVCIDKPSSPYLLVVVQTPPDHIHRRKVIRRTWGGYHGSMRLVFALGKPKNVYLQQLLEFEHEKYRDLIQGTFEDTDANSTYKHVMSLKYAVYHCQRAKFILKIDNDVFVNSGILLDFLINLNPNEIKNMFLCVENGNGRCDGYVTMYSSDVAFKFYKQAQNFPMSAQYLRPDDHLMVSIIPSISRIAHTDIKQLVRRSRRGRCDFLFGNKDGRLKEHRMLWKSLKRFLYVRCVFPKHFSPVITKIKLYSTLYLNRDDVKNDVLSNVNKFIVT